jgi:hypothetical protein
VPKAHTFAPAVALDLGPDDIREVSGWPEVAHVYLDAIAEPEMEVARSSIQASIVQRRGRSGTGQRIAMVEVGGRVAANPWLEVHQDETFACQTDHTTGVAGLINSAHPTVHGVAPGARLWVGGSCAGLTSELQDRSEAAADWGARAINVSWGTFIGLTPGAHDRFFDDMVLNRHVVVVKSAGNRAGSCAGDGYLTSPALAYNLITVGGYDDRNTNTWTDDIMDECSSYVNPVSTYDDREKPEIVAPSMNINSTVKLETSATGVGNIGSGTSWSAGLVTGGVALLMQRAPGLQFWPEAVKAILMATAVHNVEGAREVSDRDGAGGISLDRADDVARRIRGDWNGVAYECSASSPGPTVDVPMSLVAGRRTRAVIAWNSDPAYDSYDVQPSADLDLAVLDGSDTVVAHSATLDNTFELVDFVPQASGSYTLRVTAERCDMSPRYLGWAWWRAG